MNWTILSGIVGIIGLLAIPAAFVIYHLQNRTTKRISVSERQQEIYKEALDVLDVIEKGVQKAGFRVLTGDEIEGLGIESASDALEKLINDPATPLREHLSSQASLVNIHIGTLSVSGVPTVADVEFALRHPKLEDVSASEVHRLLSAMVTNGIRQYDVIKDIQGRTKKIRSVLEDYRRGVVKINAR